jgi:PAS domain S-box-containing protein
MKNSLRKSGIDIIGDVPWGTHICQFHHTKEDLTDILVPYFKAGLENNEFCLWVTSQPLEVEDAIEAFRSAVPDLDVYQKKGQIEIISYKDWFLNEGSFCPEMVSNRCAERLTYATNSGYEGVRLCGNNSWLNKDNWDSFIKFKEQMDNVICNCQMIVLCTYPLDRHNIADIIYLSVNHQFALIKRDGKWERIESYKRKMVEETAVKATKDWENTFDAVPDLIAIIDTNYKVVRANRAMASKLGMTPEECIGLTCYSVVHETIKPPSFCPHRQMLKDGFEHTAEVCENCLGGYFIVSVSPLYDSEGKLIGSIHVARDINERKIIEEALRDSEEKYRNLIETANEGIFLMNAEFKITYANKITAEKLRYTQEEIIGKSVMDFIPEDSKPIAERSLEKRRRGINESYELKLMCKDGSSFWSVISAKSLFDMDGNFTGSLGMLTDITERVQAERALLESETHFRILAENSPDIITRFDRQYRHIYANPATVESYGISLAEIIGKTQGELGRDTKKVKAWEAHLESTYVTGKTETFEYYISRQGKKHYFNTKIVPELAEGKVISVLAISREITDIKEAEAKLKVTLENLEILVKERTAELETAYNSMKESEKGLAEAQKMAHIGNWDWNILTNELYYSDELYRIFRLSPQESNVPFYEVLNYIYPDDRDYVNNAVKEALNGKRYGEVDFRVVVADGTERVVHAQGEVILDENKSPVRIKGTVQDNTDLKKSEEKIRNLANIVESSIDAIGTLSLEGTITSWNKGAEQIYGYLAEEILGKPISSLAPSHLCVETKKLSEQIMQGGSVNNYETLRLRKDGKLVDVSITLSPVYDLHGKLNAISFISRDISKRIATEKDLANFEIAREKEIHHRIKNNLQVVSSLLDLQAYKFDGRNDIKDSEVIDAFRESENRVISMALIHEELYSGGGFDNINFSAYIEKLVNNLLSTYRFGDANISLKKDLEEDLFFDMDIAIPLGTIINEVISNSLKHAFSGRDKGVIQIKLQREENGEYLKSKNENKTRKTFYLTISDNGIGFPENLDINELDSLGLQLITSLVDQLDGELEIKGNNGTVFNIKFTATEKNNQTSAPVAQQPV